MISNNASIPAKGLEISEYGMPPLMIAEAGVEARGLR
jgi:hypothetical protein